MTEKERTENLLKSVEMLDDALRFYELVRRLHRAFLKVLDKFVEENDLGGGGKREGDLH